MRVSGRNGITLLILLMAVAGSALPVHAAPVWNVQVVDDRAALNHGISVAVDSNDTPHMVYIDSENGTYYVPGSNIINQQYLMYASLTDSGWNIQTVDSMDRTEWQGSIGSVSFSALAFDPTDNPHIAYRSLDQVKYAVWTGANWSIQTIDHGNDGSLALDSDGNPHISYIGENGSLKYASWTGTNWNIQTIKSEPSGSEETVTFQCLALDSDDRASVVYCVGHGSGSTIKWAAGDSSGWTTRTVVSNANVTRFGNVVVDSRGYPRFTYNNNWNQSLMYERWNGNAWIGQTATMIQFDFYRGFLRLGANDNPCLAYNLLTEAKYARWTWSRWDIQTVAGGQFAGRSPSLALDSKGNPHIGLLNARNTNSPTLEGATVMYATSNQPLQTVPWEFLLLMFALVLAVGLLIALDYYRERRFATET